jgi:ATP-dependent Clp protease protease subunit
MTIIKLETTKEAETKAKVAEDNRNREYLLNKNVSSDSVEAIVKGIFEINRYDDKEQEKDPSFVRRPIKITVDSYGGYIYDGLLLINAIENSDTPIHTYCYSKAMSMGFITFVVGHKRFASPDATLMYHDAGTTLGDTIEGIQQSIDQTKRVVKRMDGKITSYTNIPQTKLDKIKKMKQDWYIFGDDAVELGLVDELLESKRNKNRKGIDKSN